MNRRLPSQLLIGVVLLCFYAASYGALLQQLGESEAARGTRHAAGVWSLPPVALRIIAGEFKGLVADYLTLEAGAQLGTELMRTPEGEFRVVKKEYDWPSIHRLFVASQALDPAFAQTYILAQGWLPWEANMLSETQAILQTAAANRPWDWRPLHLMGFNAYYFQNRQGEAGKLFLEAAKTPNAPPFLAILGARLAQKGGETEAAIGLMQSMLAQKDKSEPGYDNIINRLKALQGVRVIEIAVEKYEQRFNKRPSTLDELTQSGVLKSLPANPYNEPYCIDENGSVHFDSLNCANPANN